MFNNNRPQELPSPLMMNTHSMDGHAVFGQTGSTTTQNDSNPAMTPPQIKKQLSGDGAPVVNSTFENSADTYSRSKQDGELDSFSEEEDAVYVPFEYQGDGRKREAKRHKQ